MNIPTAIKPILANDGLIAVLIMTQDGLPVEMIGHGLRANVLAAELTGVAEMARKSFTTLGMGHPQNLQINLEKYNTILYGFEHHYLAVISRNSSDAEAILQSIQQSEEQINDALGGQV